MGATTHTSALTASQSIVAEHIEETAFFPNSANLFPKFPERFPRTGVEVWLFDALAADGSAVFTVSFLRDSMAAPAGFRVGINASWADGTNWSHQLVLPESKVVLQGGATTETGHVRGEWSGPDARASFEVAEDLSRAVVTFDAPDKISGALTLHSLGYDTLPRQADAARASPELFWMRPVAVADAALDMIITTDNGPKSMVIDKADGGYGGIDRSWEGMPWVKAVTDSLFARARVGPYDLQVMRLVGRPEKDYALTGTARLYRDGELVCAPLQVVKEAHLADGLEGDVLVVSKRFDEGGIAATFRDKNTGYDLEFVSKGANGVQRWKFEMRHDRVWWRKPTSPPGPKATGSSAFVSSITGGPVDGTSDVQHRGFGMDGQVEMPE